MKFPGVARGVVSICLLTFGPAAAAYAAEWYVAPGGTGTGSSAAPFGRIQSAINMAQPGDNIIIRPGIYNESLRTVRSGTSALPIRLRSVTERGSVVVTAAGRVLTVDHAYFSAEGLVFDGQYGLNDTIRISSAATSFILRNCEVRRSSHDLVDMGGPSGVLIDDCLIHHALNAAGGRTDAHGIAAGPVQRLTIRHTEIHTFSGDGLQVDPGRSAPGWQQVTVDSVRFWLAPLPQPENGFAAGIVPGENAIDTKSSAGLPRATLAVRNTTAWGFRNGLIGNMAAFNLKENISATLDRVTVFDSEIAFRLRGGGSTTNGAWVTLTNAVVYNVLTAYRYEDQIQNLRIWNNTVGRGVTRVFQAASSGSTGLNVRNLVTIGTRPAEAADSSNLALGESAFIDAARHDYRLAPGAAAIDTGATLAAVTTDRNGVTRPQGRAHDVGAYEWQPPDPAEVVVHAVDASALSGAWRFIADSSAANGTRVTHPDSGASTVGAARKAPLDFVEFSVPVQAGRQYRIWIRGRADRESPQNDSVYVQFSNALTSSGVSVYGIGTTSAMVINLEDCAGCGLRGWGWQDNGSGVEVLGALVRFATSGTQTIRVQTREDGLSIDQLVLSPVEYIASPPGRRTDDSTIVQP